MSYRLRLSTAAAAAWRLRPSLEPSSRSMLRDSQRRRLRQRRPTRFGSGCANVADVVAPYVPPPAYYAPLPEDPPPPPNINGCASYNGRWVNASGCN